MRHGFRIYTFRNHVDIIVFLKIAIIFYYISLYVKRFANYFMKINKGIDTPIDKKSGKISLSPELSATEKKIKYHKTYFRKAKT